MDLTITDKQTYQPILTPSSPTDDVALHDPHTQQAEPSQAAPCARLLGMVSSVRDNIRYGLRVIGAGLCSAGLTGLGCAAMMDSDATAAQTVLVTVGAGAYIAGSYPIFEPVYYRSEYLRQSLKDAVVPALTAMSVYLAKAHEVI